MYLWKLSSLRVAEATRGKVADLTGWVPEDFIIVTDGREAALSISEGMQRKASLETLNNLSDFMDGVVWRDSLT
jgi:hypothetical protein